jgi:hypothetical protein
MKNSLSGGKMKFLMDLFQREVERGNYKRIPYKEWRILSKVDSFGSVSFSYNESEGMIHLYPSENTKEMCIYAINDKSFGQFFYDVELKERLKNENMISSNTTTASSIPANMISDSYITTTTPLGQYPNYNYHNTFTGQLYIDENNINKVSVENIKKEEKKENKMKNFDFGPFVNNTVRVSMYGLAVRNEDNTWVSYDKNSGDIIDVDILNFDGSNYLYKIPVAIKEIAPGDVIIHRKYPVIVTEVKDGNITAVDIKVNEKKIILPTKNVFGFDFVTKVVSLFDNIQKSGNAPDADHPFGNMLPLLMLSDENKDTDPMMLMMLMNGGNTGDINPQQMMMVMAMSGKSKSDMLPMLMMMNSGFMNTTKKED